MRQFCLSLLIFFPIYFVSAQTDTLISFSIITHRIDTILPPVSDTSVTFDYSLPYAGTLGNQAVVNLAPPSSNLFRGSAFTDIYKAQESFDLTDYPVRCAVKLHVYYQEKMSSGCTGMMIGQNFVLTAAHCVYASEKQHWLYDSIRVAPAYNNGHTEICLPVSMVDKYFIPKTFYDNSEWDDIALLQLRQPIGEQTGWVGLAFAEDQDFFTGKVFHKFSYPAVASLIDSSRIFNGDTLYYNYGLIDVLSQRSLGINSPGAVAIPGQSGSSLLYTDNTNWYTFGVLSFANHYRHYRISKGIFYSLKNVIRENEPSSSEFSASADPVVTYNNPFRENISIEFHHSAPGNVLLSINTPLGQVIRIIQNFNGNRITLPRELLSKGLYILQLISEGQIFYSAKMVVK